MVRMPPGSGGAGTDVLALALFDSLLAEAFPLDSPPVRWALQRNKPFVTPAAGFRALHPSQP
jgi:hypothetical protein